MTNATVVDATNVVVANVVNESVITEIVAFAQSKLNVDVDTLKSDYAKHMAKRATFDEIISLDRKLVGSGWACLRDKLTSELYGAEYGNNATLVGESKRLIALLNDYETWNDERERLENALELAMHPLRQLVAAFNALTGDQTINKTFERGGNKTLSTGKRSTIGYMCQIVNAKTETVVTYNDENGNVIDKFNGLNDVCRHLGFKIKSRSGELVDWYNQNAKSCRKRIRAAGYILHELANSVEIESND